MMSNEFKSPSSEVLVKKTKESIPKLFKVILLKMMITHQWNML